MTVVEPNHAPTSPVVETIPPVAASRVPGNTVAAGEFRQQVTYPQPGTAVLTVAGEIDAATVPRLDEMLQSRLFSQLSRLVLDLSPVGFLAVSGVGTLQTAEHRAQCSGAEFMIVTGGNTPVTRALQATAGQHSLHWHTGSVASGLAGTGDARIGG